MTARELKQLFVDFFTSRGHVEIPSASLIPENDSTTLFISAGMHPLVPFLLGQPHPLGKRLVDVQKCVRTGDIEEVGNKFHHTFFEMLGNWSLGDYYKETMIPWSHEFLTQALKYDPGQIHVTCFAGDSDAPRDEESAALWRSVGIPDDRIHFLPKKDNWWGPAGITGPCGPDSEMFVDLHPEAGQIDFSLGCQQGRIVEIGNDVFMQYNKTSDSKYVLLSQKNVDTGYGVERNVAIINGLTDNYLTDIWQPIIQKVEELSGKKYSQESLPCQGEVSGKHRREGFGESATDFRRPMRIIADHLRAAVFIIADGVEPSNKEAGYVLRRFIRRSIRQGKLLGIENNFTKSIALAVFANQDNYAGVYPQLDKNQDKILATIDTEEIKFRKTLNRGLSQINKLIARNHNVTGKQAFDLYQSFGFPIEMVQEELAKSNLSLDLNEFNKFKLQHIEQSRTLSAGKFKSGLADNSEIITKYHTVTHLLHAALRQVLGVHVQQAGSNITSERLRFDFSHSEKLTSNQLKSVEDLVNQKIEEGIDVAKETMPFTKAQSTGTLAFFGAKYPEIVSVYTIGNFSKEVCAGPHVDNTAALGQFKIIREESAGSGKRRLYANLK